MEDALAVAAAVARSRDALRRWMVWYSDGYDLRAAEEWIASSLASATVGTAFQFAILRSDEDLVGVLGFEDIGNEAGLTKHLSFDMCRWTCALTDYRAGEDPDKIRQNLGVSKIQWRELYIKLKQLSGM